ncbi:hypothetical protein AYI68_g1812 [Smittium mucronatum]|uniref:Uncharacterized protein n=1 Tax=Smittium mucronatum TaxID=133383 RepID=A0A1R0H4K4_9FUNG|nr:hypothetical protein AYI68_g1812 [Smittium mucronatum]
MLQDTRLCEITEKAPYHSWNFGSNNILVKKQLLASPALVTKPKDQAMEGIKDSLSLVPTSTLPSKYAHLISQYDSISSQENPSIVLLNSITKQTPLPSLQKELGNIIDASSEFNTNEDIESSTTAGIATPPVSEGATEIGPISTFSLGLGGIIEASSEFNTEFGDDLLTSFSATATTNPNNNSSITSYSSSIPTGSLFESIPDIDSLFDINNEEIPETGTGSVESEDIRDFIRVSLLKIKQINQILQTLRRNEAPISQKYPCEIGQYSCVYRDGISPNFYKCSQDGINIFDACKTGTFCSGLSGGRIKCAIFNQTLVELNQSSDKKNELSKLLIGNCTLGNKSNCAVGSLASLGVNLNQISNKTSKLNSSNLKENSININSGYPYDNAKNKTIGSKTPESELSPNLGMDFFNEVNPKSSIVSDSPESIGPTVIPQLKNLGQSQKANTPDYFGSSVPYQGVLPTMTSQSVLPTSTYASGVVYSATLPPVLTLESGIMLSNTATPGLPTILSMISQASSIIIPLSGSLRSFQDSLDGITNVEDSQLVFSGRTGETQVVQSSLTASSAIFQPSTLSQVQEPTSTPTITSTATSNSISISPISTSIPILQTSKFVPTSIISNLYFANVLPTSIISNLYYSTIFSTSVLPTAVNYSAQVLPPSASPIISPLPSMTTPSSTNLTQALTTPLPTSLPTESTPSLIISTQIPTTTPLPTLLPVTSSTTPISEISALSSTSIPTTTTIPTPSTSFETTLSPESAPSLTSTFLPSSVTFLSTTSELIQSTESPLIATSISSGSSISEPISQSTSFILDPSTIPQTPLSTISASSIAIRSLFTGPPLSVSSVPDTSIQPTTISQTSGLSSEVAAQPSTLSTFLTSALETNQSLLSTIPAGSSSSEQNTTILVTSTPTSTITLTSPQTSQGLVSSSIIPTLTRLETSNNSVVLTSTQPENSIQTTPVSVASQTSSILWVLSSSSSLNSASQMPQYVGSYYSYSISVLPTLESSIAYSESHPSISVLPTSKSSSPIYSASSPSISVLPTSISSSPIYSSSSPSISVLPTSESSSPIYSASSPSISVLPTSISSSPIYSSSSPSISVLPTSESSSPLYSSSSPSITVLPTSESSPPSYSASQPSVSILPTNVVPSNNYKSSYAPPLVLPTESTSTSTSTSTITSTLTSTVTLTSSSPSISVLPTSESSSSTPLPSTLSSLSLVSYVISVDSTSMQTKTSNVYVSYHTPTILPTENSVPPTYSVYSNLVSYVMASSPTNDYNSIGYTFKYSVSMAPTVETSLSYSTAVTGYFDYSQLGQPAKCTSGEFKCLVEDGQGSLYSYCDSNQMPLLYQCPPDTKCYSPKPGNRNIDCIRVTISQLPSSLISQMTISTNSENLSTVPNAIPNTVEAPTTLSPTITLGASSIALAQSLLQTWQPASVVPVSPLETPVPSINAISQQSNPSSEDITTFITVTSTPTITLTQTSLRTV